MHVDGFVRGKGKFIRTEYVPTDEKTGPRFPLLLTTGRILSQYNVGAQTRRTANVVWHDEDVLEIHPHDAEVRGVRDGEWVRLASRSGETIAARKDHRPGLAGCGLHDVPPPRHAGQRHHHRLIRLGDELPGIQGDGGAGRTVERADRMAGGLCGAGRTGRAASCRQPSDGNEAPPCPAGVRCRCGSSRGVRVLPEEVAVALSLQRHHPGGDDGDARGDWRISRSAFR